MTLGPIIGIVIVTLGGLWLLRAINAGRTGSWVDPDDPAIAVAQAEARSTLPAFFDRLERPQSGDLDFMLKFRLRSGGKAEQIWAEQIAKDGDRLSGRLANPPRLRGYSEGQEVEIPREDILDWGYRQGGVMQGHFSTRVLMPQMPRKVAAHICRRFGWDPPG